MDLQEDHPNRLIRILNKIARLYLNDFCYELTLLIRWHKSYRLLNPKTFSEKLCWLKLFKRDLSYKNLVDKITVKKFIESKIGKKYLVKTLGIWKNIDMVNWEKLPNQFVIKTNHASGAVFVVRDKNKDVNQDLIDNINSWLSQDYVVISREYLYKGIERKILIEELLLDEHDELPKDYKIYCFNGEPKFIHVDVDRFINHKRAIFSLDWEKLPFTIRHENYDGDLPRPKNLNEMINIAKKLSDGLPFVRVDLFNTGKIYFGELTIFPGSCIEQFRTKRYDEVVGKMLKI